MTHTKFKHASNLGLALAAVASILTVRHATAVVAPPSQSDQPSRDLRLLPPSGPVLQPSGKPGGKGRQAGSKKDDNGGGAGADKDAGDVGRGESGTSAKGKGVGGQAKDGPPNEGKGVAAQAKDVPTDSAAEGMPTRKAVNETGKAGRATERADSRGGPDRKRANSNAGGRTNEGRPGNSGLPTSEAATPNADRGPSGARPDSGTQAASLQNGRRASRGGEPSDGVRAAEPRGGGLAAPQSPEEVAPRGRGHGGNNGEREGVEARDGEGRSLRGAAIPGRRRTAVEGRRRQSEDAAAHHSRPDGDSQGRPAEDTSTSVGEPSAAAPAVDAPDGVSAARKPKGRSAEAGSSSRQHPSAKGPGAPKKRGGKPGRTGREAGEQGPDTEEDDEEIERKGKDIAITAQIDPESAGKEVARAAEADPHSTGKAVALAAAFDPVSTGKAIAYSAAQDPNATGAALAHAGLQDAAATGKATAYAAVQDPVSTGKAIARAAELDSETLGIATASAASEAPAATGVALITSAIESPAATAATLRVSARADVAATAQALAAGPARDPGALALLGEVAPVEAWVPEKGPELGWDPTGQGHWQRVGSPPPIDRILARFSRTLPGAHVAVNVLSGRPVGVPGLPASRVVSHYLTLAPENFSVDEMFTAHSTFFVEKSWLDANQIHQWSIEFNRFDEDLRTWTPSVAKRVREDEERVFYSVVIPGFSLWAISGAKDTAPRRFRVDELTITPADAREGQPVTVAAQVTNLSDAVGDYNAVLWLDSLANSSLRLRLGPNETLPVEFTVEPAAGVYEVRIDRLFGSLSVKPAAAPDPEPAKSTRSHLATAILAPIAAAGKLPLDNAGPTVAADRSASAGTIANGPSAIRPSRTSVPAVGILSGPKFASRSTVGPRWVLLPNAGLSGAAGEISKTHLGVPPANLGALPSGASPDPRLLVRLVAGGGVAAALGSLVYSQTRSGWRRKRRHAYGVWRGAGALYCRATRSRR